MGYVGSVSAASLAALGHDVVGIDSNATKVEAVAAGGSAVKEPGLAELIARTVKEGRLAARREGRDLVAGADVSLICVGTPSGAEGGPDLEYLRRVAAEIGSGLRDRRGYHVVVVRSTVFPGTTRAVVAPILEQSSGAVPGRDFGLASNPEFLREASALADFLSPALTVIGELDARSGDAVARLYDGVQAPVHRVSLEEAESIKLVNNAFHALKIGFANEVGRLCERLNIDGRAVMDMVCADRKLNISTAYLKPGFAFGGSCLPKDLRSILHHGRRMGVELPILEGILPSNRIQIDAVRVRVHGLGKRRLAVLGLGFKPGTDDLRESPVIPLVRDLWQDGFDISVYDPDIVLADMLGANREYLERQLPQIRDILKPGLAEALHGSEAVLVSQSRPEFREAIEGLAGRLPVIDVTATRRARATEIPA
jgi:GDP-mannose 6-dehydrogenase